MPNPPFELFRQSSTPLVLGKMQTSSFAHPSPRETYRSTNAVPCDPLPLLRQAFAAVRGALSAYSLESSSPHEALTMNSTPLDPLSRVPLVLAALRGRLRAFSADGASPHEATSEERRSCVEFLSELRGLGAHLDSLGTLEDMFFTVLRDPAAGGKWEGQSPFSPDTGVIEWDRLLAASLEYSESIGLASLAPDVAKELFPAVAKFLQDASREQWRQGIEAGVSIVGRPESLSIGQILRGALFIVLARPTGITDMEKVRALVSTELRAAQEDTLDDTATAIRRASGLTKAQWQRAGRGAAPTV